MLDFPRFVRLFRYRATWRVWYPLRCFAACELHVFDWSWLPVSGVMAGSCAFRLVESLGSNPELHDRLSRTKSFLLSDSAATRVFLVNLLCSNA